MLHKLRIDSQLESETAGFRGFSTFGSEYPFIDSPFYDDFGGAQMVDTSSPIDEDISVTEFLNGVLKDGDEHLYDDTTSQENSTACFIISTPDCTTQSAPAECLSIKDSGSNGSDAEGMLIGAGQVSLYIVIFESFLFTDFASIDFYPFYFSAI